MHTIAKFIYFKVLGWKMIGDFPDVDRCVFMVVPHTSWVDFFLGVLVRSVWNEPIDFIAKKSLFRFPFGWYFKWMGGTPIDRNTTNDTVSAIAGIFSKRDTFRLALSPEGTRKKVTNWKTGFYYIAKSAEVPIVLVAFDYGKKQVKISSPLFPTENKEADFKIYRNFFKDVKGRIPEYSFDVQQD